MDKQKPACGIEPDEDRVRQQPVPAEHQAKHPAELSDEQLLYCYDRLHHPHLLADRWVSDLHAEVVRRGLRRIS